MMLPSLFVSHGSPMLALTPSPARDFLTGLGATLPRPAAIVIASAHWETERPAVNAVAENVTIHDFYGFPSALYELRYPAPGSAAVAGRVAGLLEAAGLGCEVDHARGLDHGAWVPLLLMYPAQIFRLWNCRCRVGRDRGIICWWARRWRRCAPRACW